MVGHQRLLCRASRPALAFRGSRFAVEWVGRDRSEPDWHWARRRFLARRSAGSASPPYQNWCDQSAFAVRISASGSLAARISARPGPVRFPRPGSVATLPVRYRESISVERGLPQADLVPATNLRSFADVARAHANCAVAAKSTSAISGRPSA